ARLEMMDAGRDAADDRVAAAERERRRGGETDRRRTGIDRGRRPRSVECRRGAEKRAARSVEEDAERAAVVGADGEKVGTTVAVDVGGGKGLAAADDGGCGESRLRQVPSRTVAEQDGDGGRADAGVGKVRQAVAVEVADRDRIRSARPDQCRRYRRERSVSD